VWPSLGAKAAEMASLEGTERSLAMCQLERKKKTDSAVFVPSYSYPHQCLNRTIAAQRE
jgi:hypothetical protein